MPLSPGNSGEEGERANGKRPRQRKMDPKKKRQKESIRCRQDTAEYAGQEDSAERVPAVWA